MRGAVAFVTGGASGIGKALCAALDARGASVVVADIDESGATDVARGLAAGSAVGLDVRDAEAVAEAIVRTHSEAGRLDLLFNNAGIGVGGPVEELTLPHWERIIDVNLRGVVHGVHAAYPLMVAQRSGHIVNTASLAGLLPFPFGAPYAMTKYAVVGLSLSLRAEARHYGVRVSAVCPGVIDTPILDTEGPEDLPRTSIAGIGREMFLRANRGAPYPPERLAEDVLDGVDRNRPIIVAPARARVAWRAARLYPGLLERVAERELRWARSRLAANRAVEAREHS